jgi:hypothetical protein
LTGLQEDCGCDWRLLRNWSPTWKEMRNTLGELLKLKDIVLSQRNLEDELNIISKLQKAIRELQARIEVNEEELEAEWQARPKSKKQ